MRTATVTGLTGIAFVAVVVAGLKRPGMFEDARRMSLLIPLGFLGAALLVSSIPRFRRLKRFGPIRRDPSMPADLA